MGRPAKTLLERVRAGSFRADRYGSLLAGELLPKTSPFSDPFRRRIWEELREAQQEYQEAVDGELFSAEWYRRVAAGGFSKSVRALHGGRPPSWTREKADEPSALSPPAGADLGGASAEVISARRLAGESTLAQ